MSGTTYTIMVRVVDRDGRAYATAARLTGRHVVTAGGLRFSRTTGKENAIRRNRHRWTLDATSLRSVWLPTTSEARTGRSYPPGRPRCPRCGADNGLDVRRIGGAWGCILCGARGIAGRPEGLAPDGRGTDGGATTRAEGRGA